METEDQMKSGTDSQDSGDIGTQTTSKLDAKSTIHIPMPSTSNPNLPATSTFKLKPSSKGVENAKKRLRAFSIQKKTPITPISVNKSVTGNKAHTGSGNTTVFIGKLSGVKVTPKPDDAEPPKQKPPRPPKPGQSKKLLQDSYTELQKRTLSEIEDMKRKMELVELGIPLGLICPTATSEKAMPTKAMPPIKSFLDPAKLDEIIYEAKKAKAEGKEFKFDYQKLLPDYDNPFQTRKDAAESAKKQDFEKDFFKKQDKDKRKTDRYDRDSRRYSSHRKDEKDRRRDRKEEKDRHRDKSKDKESKKEAKTEPKKSAEKETDVNLSDYLVCDSWSLENEDKTSSLSPRRYEILQSEAKKSIDLQETSGESVKTTSLLKEKGVPLKSPEKTPIRKTKRLQPVVDSFKFEIDPDEDDILDIFDQNTALQKYSKVTQKKSDDSSFDKMFDFDQSSKDASNDALTEDTFLESVINEIKQEAMSDDEDSQDKGLVEYDSPTRDSPSPKDARSVTPELDDRMREVQSSRSDYSDGYRSGESGYKSTESGYKSSASFKSDNSESYRLSVEKELIEMPKSTIDSLETWSFVLKICQPLLFRHDRNKCYRETRCIPKIWYTENPKLCSCVKDRAIVYDELETCKMNLVDRVYGCDQIQESEFPKVRGWYPRFAQCLTESNTLTTVAPSTEWEADDSQTETLLVKEKTVYKTNRSTTPAKNEEIYLDREYQRFMEAVWPEVTESKTGTPRSTTPVKQETRKKKSEETAQDNKKKTKRIKLSSEGWSQESDVEEEVEKAKKISKMQKSEKVKMRKRKLSPSLSDSDDNSKRKRKANKKVNKKTKAKINKRRRLSKKYLKKLKEKQKKKKKYVSEDEEIERENRKKEKKLKRKKLQKKKKIQKKKKSKAKSSSSSSSTSSLSTSETSTDSESETSIKKRKKSSVKKKKRKQSSSESTQSEDLFDVNVLNNIKTERLTDDEKKLEFSPRRQKPREIINVKELQNDFVGSVQIKQEVEDKEINQKQKNQDRLEVAIQREEKESAEESVSESVTLSNFESVSQGVTDSVSQSAARSDCEDTTKKEIVCQSVTEPVSQIVKESVCQKENESDCQSVKENISQSVKDSVPQSLVSNDEPKTSTETSSEKVPVFPVPEMAPEIVPEIILENIPVPKDEHIIHFKEPLDVNLSTPQDRTEAAQPEELSQCSSQESNTSKDPYEKDDSHLRPSSQNSNYSFNDVINASQNYHKEEEDKFEPESYEEGNYEIYEQLAMAYQSDVAKQGNFQSAGEVQGEWWGSQRIETVVRTRSRGEIKCDWRAGCAPPTAAVSGARPLHRPSRWGLKPGEVNIVLTGGNNDVYPIRNVVEPVYQIQTLANNRADTCSTGSYDEAYEDMYGASDRLQYGDCFSTDVPEPEVPPPTSPTSPTEAKKPLVTSSSLDERIDRALKTTVLGEVAKITDDSDDKDVREKGILHTKSARSAKRVSFADGYKPGQDSDVEEPPKRKKARRFGCAWPCPASHPDHVPLWDALPPPPPPPGSPPPPFSQVPPNMIPQQLMMQQRPPMMQQPPPMMQQPPPLMQQPPPLMQPPPSMLQQQPPPMLQQQPPQMLQQQTPHMMQPPRQMMQPPPPQIIQQQLMQQQQMLQQQGINPAMLQAPPFAMGQKIDPSVSLPNFMPPEPPPGLISF